MVLIFVRLDGDLWIYLPRNYIKRSRSWIIGSCLLCISIILGGIRTDLPLWIGSLQLLNYLLHRTGYRRHWTLKSHLILVNVYFFKSQFQIKRAHFFLGIFYMRSIFYTNCSTLFLRDYLATKSFSSPRKIGPHAQQHPVHHFPSHQLYIDLKDLWKLQYPQKKVSILK